MAAAMIELEEEIEGERLETSDFFFDKIGEAVPVKPSDHIFDTETLPSHPLAVSERHGLVFVAHSNGFCVARTKDVVESAKAIKRSGAGSSIQELSIVDVHIGRVHILSLSAGSSTLSACVYPGEIHFFLVESLLGKDQKPIFSCSINESCSVRAMQWNKKLENSYIVLSEQGNLYHGSIKETLKNVKDNVDAVEWSVDGNFVAVAQENVVVILSSKFEERVSLSLPFRPPLDDSDVTCDLKVDTIRWVRLDCIILGCIQLCGDGVEGYLVQVLTSRSGKIYDVSSEPVVLSFSEIFPGLSDEIVPSMCGPNLFLSYLEECELAITANKKNTDQHVVLIGWSLCDGSSEAAVIDIERDNLLPRIELQENGDDNLILGLCIDKVSIYDKVKVQFGVEELRELSPYCVLMCLTLEGKLLMFHVASVKGTRASAQSVSTFPEDEEHISAVASLEKDVNKSSMLMPVAEQISQSKGFIGNQEMQAPVSIWASKADGKQTSLPSGWRGEISESSPFKPSISDHSIYAVRGISDSGTQETVGGEFRSNNGWSIHKELQESSSGRATLPETTASPLSFGQINRSETSGPKDNFITNCTPVHSNIVNSLGKSDCSIGHGTTVDRRKIVPLPFKSTQSFSQDVSTLGKSSNHKFHHAMEASRIQFEKSELNSSKQSGNIVPLPFKSSSQSFSQDGSTLGKSSNHNFHLAKEVSRISFEDSEPNLSKQFGNINDMVKELDALLRCIEEPGGFKDECFALQKGSVAALEQGIGSLSEKCRMWRSIMDDRHGETQHLLDRTVQVLARKIYLEGIVKQSTDVQYWDIWNRQKLSSEFELKRRHILEVNQDLTNQLIELERHFNTLELNKFGVDGGSNVRRTGCKFDSPRHMQSLHSFHNVMSSQLAAAEQLSECLSKQMAMLSIESPAIQQKVKKELFETIGIPYDHASLSSPEASQACDAKYINESSLSSRSASTKSQRRRSQSDSMSFEPETVRRRDSLNQSWTRFEPSKTIVKRMLLHSEEGSGTKSSLSAGVQDFGPQKLVRSAAALPKDVRPSAYFYNRKIGTPDTSIKELSSESSFFRLADDLPGYLQSGGHNSPTSQLSPRNNLSAVNPFPGTQSPFIVDHNNSRGTFALATGSVSASETKFNFLSENMLGQTSTVPTSLPAHSHLQGQSVSKISGATSTKADIQTSNTTIGNSNQFPLTTENSYSEYQKNHGSLFSAGSASPAIFAMPGKDSQLDSVTSRSQHNEKVSSSPASLMPPPDSSVSLSALTTPSASPYSSSASFSNSSSVISFKAPDTSSSPITSTSESPKLEFQLPKEKCSLKIDVNTIPQAQQLKPGLPPSHSSSEPEPSSGVPTSVPDAQPEPPSPTQNFLLTSQLPESAHGGNNDNVDIQVRQDDNMEEEVSDSSQITGLSLGGFGIGTVPSTTAAKPNPFGTMFSSPPSSSPFSLAVPSGELFRPASFSIQSQQTPQPSQPANFGFSGGFNGNTIQAPAGSAFGQPAQIGGGQQALGSVLGSFGQSRQIGVGLPTGFASASSFGSGFSGAPSTGGFLNTSTGGSFSSGSASATGGGGFAGAASGGGGFAGVASAVGGFAGVASGGGGFGGALSGGSGFAGAASGGGGFVGAASAGGMPATGGVFGAGGFSAFGGGAGASRPPSPLFTQMRK